MDHGDEDEGRQVTAVKGSIRIGQVRGVALRTHWSVPVLLLLFAWSLGSRTLPAWAPGRTTAVYAAAGVAGALLLLASLVAHETAHALTARRAGIPVRDITLWAMGGVTRMDQPRSARAALAVAVSGPLASLLVAGVALGAAAGADAAVGPRLSVGLLVWLGGINVVLAVFNLLPAAPLDGGRVLQAAVWWRTGDRDRADRVAGRGGQIVGTLLLAGGLLAVLGRGAVSGLWLALIGLFITVTAAAERQRALLRTALRGVRVAEALSGPVSTAPDWLTVDRFLADDPVRASDGVVGLVDFEGHPSGLLDPRRLAMVPAAHRESVRLRDAATPVGHCLRAAPEEPLDAVLERVRPGVGLPVLVMDDGRLSGVVTAEDISRLVRRHRPVPGEPVPPARPGAGRPRR